MLDRLTLNLLLLTVLAVLFCGSGCESLGVTTPVPRVPASESVKKVAADNSAFAFDLYQQLRQSEEGNLFFSPYSISTALAMTYAGARGETEQQMCEVMHFGLPQSDLHAATSALANDLDGAGKGRGYQLHIANRLWGREDVKFLDPFLAVTRDDYRAELTRLDFAGQTEKSRQTINSWVEKQTNDRIKELLKPGIVKGTTLLVLTNAIYFKGDWAEKFEKDRTRDEPFHLSADKKVAVPMMFQNCEFRLAELEELKMLELPYRGEDLSMLVLLPEENVELAAIEEQLSLEKLEAWRAKLAKQEVNVWLPRFKMTSEFQLNEALIDLGMSLPFSAEADFSGMTGSKDIYISAVVHKAFVEVNEEGTEAAAATAVVADEAGGIMAQFRADRPFLLLICDNHTGSILFFGRLTNPQA